MPDPIIGPVYAEPARPESDAVAADLAAMYLDIQTLGRRGSDGLDFHELAVWQIQDVLVAAYRRGHRAGFEAAKDGGHA